MENMTRESRPLTKTATSSDNTVSGTTFPLAGTRSVNGGGKDVAAVSVLRTMDNSLSHAVSSACDWLIGQQKPDGHWVGPVASNASMEAEWCLALWFLGLEDHPLRPRLGKALLEMQREDGSWGTYYGAGNGDINATVESYAALRSLGYPADDPAISRAATWIASKGGLKNIRVFTRYWLALIGEWPWEKTPNLPPEVIWFPNNFVFSIYNFAQWARATLVPLAILSARRPSRPLRPQDRLDVLFPGACEFRLRTARQRSATCGTSSSARRTVACTGCSPNSSSAIPCVRPPSGTCWNGSSAIRMPMVAGAASSRHGCTA